MISRDSDMRRFVLEQLHNSAQHAGHCTVRGIGFLEAPDAVEVTKEFVGAVDEMDNHLSTDYADYTDYVLLLNKSGARQ